MKILACPNCGGILNVDSEHNFTCEFCGNHFQDESASSGSLNMKDSLKNLSYRELIEKLPNYYKIETSPRGGISLKIPVNKTLHPFFIMFALIFMFSHGIGGIISLILTLSNFNFVSLIASIPFLLIGVISGWAFFYMTLDTVEIKLDKEQYSKTLKPLPIPFLPDILISSSEITQIYCKKDSNYTQNRRPVYKYYLCVESRNGVTKIVSAKNPMPIWAMEILMERVLGIEDVIVDEEYEQLT